MEKRKVSIMGKKKVKPTKKKKTSSVKKKIILMTGKEKRELFGFIPLNGFSEE